MAYRLKNQQWNMITPEGDLPLSQIAQNHPRAFYLYNLADPLARADVFLRSGHSIHYAMKANSHPRLLKALAARGLGVDVVSLGELQKALAHGFQPGKVIFSGVAKDREEPEAALYQRIFQINVESFEELQLLESLAREQNVVADIALRLNIRLAAPTHAHVQTTTPDSKFGLDLAQLPEVLDWLRGKAHINVKGLATHVGSQIVELDTFTAMARQMGEIFQHFKQQGIAVERLDLGGGLGIDYHTSGEDDLTRAEKYIQALNGAHGTGARVLLEPGRFLVARMGVLMAKVIYIKKTSSQNFMILNAGMNFLMRPALYQAFHRIVPVKMDGAPNRYTVVGPICESTDKFAVDREMPSAVRGDWVAVFDTGAYGATMANTYNESPLPEQWSLLDGIWEVQ